MFSCTVTWFITGGKSHPHSTETNVICFCQQKNVNNHVQHVFFVAGQSSGFEDMRFGFGSIPISNINRQPEYELLSSIRFKFHKFGKILVGGTVPNHPYGKISEWGLSSCLQNKNKFLFCASDLTFRAPLTSQI